MQNEPLKELFGISELKSLQSMLTFRRPAGSPTERNFISTWIKPLGMEQDGAGNLIKKIGDSPVLWSCHTDTVHRKGGMQIVSYHQGYLWTADKNSNCLGADDTAGCWLLREMILAKKPGLYVFHRGEEVGGKGSSFICDDTPELLDGIQMAVAFDRRGTSSVITHQWGGRCCSNTFADTFCIELGMGHKLDSGGSFTDTANYTDLVPECTNVSVGYYSEHSDKESLDTNYLFQLRDNILKMDVESLVVERDPSIVDSYAKYDRYENDFTGQWDRHGWDVWEDQEPRPRHTVTLWRLVRDNPDEVADALEEYGISATMLAEDIARRGGVV